MWKWSEHAQHKERPLNSFLEWDLHQKGHLHLCYISARWESHGVGEVDMAKKVTCLVERSRQMAVALDALDVWQMLVALHQGIIVCLLVKLAVHQCALLLARLCLQKPDYISNKSTDSPAQHAACDIKAPPVSGPSEVAA